MTFIFFDRESPVAAHKKPVFDGFARLFGLGVEKGCLEVKTKKPTNPLRASPVFFKHHELQNLVAGAGFEPTTFGL